MCWEWKSRVSEPRNETVADDRTEEIRAKRTGVIEALVGDADKQGKKAEPDRAPVKETVPAE